MHFSVRNMSWDHQDNDLMLKISNDFVAVYVLNQHIIHIVQFTNITCLTWRYLSKMLVQQLPNGNKTLLLIDKICRFLHHIKNHCVNSIIIFSWTRWASSWLAPQSSCPCPAHLVFHPHTRQRSLRPEPSAGRLPSPLSVDESEPSPCTPLHNRSHTWCVSASSGHTLCTAQCCSEGERQVLK